MGQVFNFEVGDIFHYWENGKDYSTRIFDKKLDRITIIEKKYSDNQDTLIYKRMIEGYIYYLASTPPGSELPFEYKYRPHSSTDEIRFTDLDSSIFYYLYNTYPFYYLNDYDWENFDTTYMVSDTLAYKSEAFCNTTINGYVFNDWWKYDLAEYGEGLGLTKRYSAAEECICITMDYEMIFYKKGSDSCGYPDNRTITGFISKQLSGKIMVFPNPAEDYIYLEIPNELIPIFVQVYNINSQVVLEYLLNTSVEEIDVKDINPGVYYLCLIGDRYIYIVKILKN